MSIRTSGTRLVAAGVVAAALTACGDSSSPGSAPSNGSHSDAIVVPGLKVLDGSWDVWHTTKIEEILPEGSDTIRIKYQGGTTPCDGLVGYAVEESESALLVTVVVGQPSDRYCIGTGPVRLVTVPLRSPIDDRQLVQSNYDGPVQRVDGESPTNSR